MPPLPADRALRAMVADLATRSETDLKSVLEALDSPQRRKIELLLVGYARGQTSAQLTTPRRLEGLSPWLAARVLASFSGFADSEVGSRGFSLTPTAAAALRDCATALQAQQGSPDVPSANVLGGWIARLKRLNVQAGIADMRL